MEAFQKYKKEYLDHRINIKKEITFAEQEHKKFNGDKNPTRKNKNKNDKIGRLLGFSEVKLV